MRCGGLIAFLVPLVAITSWAQLLDGATIKGPKVCVADVANSSGVPIPTDELKSHLVDGLRKAQVNAENTYAVTILASTMTISADNRTVMHRHKCGSMVLSEVAKAEDNHDASTQPPILVFNFGLFKKDGTAIRHGTLPVEGGSTPADSAVVTADKAVPQLSVAATKK